MVAVLPVEDMPIDKWGNRAHVAVDPNSTVARSILGRAYQPYFTGAIRDFIDVRREFYNVPSRIKEDYFLKPENRKAGEEMALDLGALYRCFSNGEYRTQAYWYDQTLTLEEQLQELAHVFNHGISLFIRTDNEKCTTEAFYEIREKFPPRIGPITITDYYGNKVETVENIQISENYYILLDKVADSAAAVNSPKLQQHGLLARLTEQDRFSTPGRQQPGRPHGESEKRGYGINTSPEAMAELDDRCNNQESMAIIAREKMTAPYPTRIERIIDRSVKEYDPRPLRIVRSYTNGDGWDFHWRPYEPEWDPVAVKEACGE